jgi:phage-related minor tail protein
MTELVKDTTTLPVALELDTRRFQSALADADRMSRAFSTSLSRSLGGAARQGQGLERVLINVGLRLARIAMRPLMQGLSGAIAKGFGGGFGEDGGDEDGEVGSSLEMEPTAFARGGVLSAPTYFPIPQGGGLGLAGERGAEAILPLARGPDGRLGVRSDGGGGGGGNITVNIHTPDVEGFRRSEAAVSTALARAVARGRRGL